MLKGYSVLSIKERYQNSFARKNLILTLSAFDLGGKNGISQVLEVHIPILYWTVVKFRNEDLREDD